MDVKSDEELIFETLSPEDKKYLTNIFLYEHDFTLERWAETLAYIEPIKHYAASKPTTPNEKLEFEELMHLKSNIVQRSEFPECPFYYSFTQCLHGEPFVFPKAALKRRNLPKPHKESFFKSDIFKMILFIAVVVGLMAIVMLNV